MLRSTSLIPIASIMLLSVHGDVNGQTTRPGLVPGDNIQGVFQELPYQGPAGWRRLILMEARISSPNGLAPTAFSKKYGDQPPPNVALLLIDATFDGRIEGPIIWCYYFGMGRILTTLSATVLSDTDGHLEIVVAYGRPGRMLFEVFKADRSDVAGEYPIALDLMSKEHWPEAAKPVSTAILDLSRSSTELCALTSLKALSLEQGIVVSMERKAEPCTPLYLYYDRQTFAWSRAMIAPGEPVPSTR